MKTILLIMNINNQSLLVFVGLLGIVWAIFLMTHNRGNKTANKFLAILIFVLSTFVLRRMADFSPSSFFDFIYFLSHAFIYLIGPSVYFYVKNVIGEGTSFKNIWIHYLPWVITMIFMGIVFYFKESIIKIDNLEILKTISIAFITFQVGHILGYIFYARKQVKIFEKKFSKQQSSLSEINFKWIKRLMIIVTILGALILWMHILIVTGSYYEINNSADFLFLLMLCFIILIIIYRSWKQPEIISGIYKDYDKYKNSKLSTDELTNLKSLLDQLVNNDKVYLTPELSLNQLASKLNVSSHLTSQLINEHYNQTFIGFINNFRIEFAKEAIKKGEIKGMTLEGIAYESGFNSKSAFNRAFKKHASCTPKDYYNSIK